MKNESLWSLYMDKKLGLYSLAAAQSLNGEDYIKINCIANNSFTDSSENSLACLNIGSSPLSPNYTSLFYSNKLSTNGFNDKNLFKCCLLFFLIEFHWARKI